ncbi:MAG: hypothetical protein ACOYUZ_01795 [Patescibacteria group bacterium]
MRQKDRTTADKIRYLSNTNQQAVLASLIDEARSALLRIPTEIRSRHLVLQLLERRLLNQAPVDDIVELWYKLEPNEFPEISAVLSAYDIVYQKELRKTMKPY